MSRWAVVARAWAASALAVACALWAHIAAGGAVSSWLGPLLALALGSVLALPLIRTRPGWLRTLALFLPAQLAYHFLFASMGSSTPPDGGSPVPAHAHHASMGAMADGAGSMPGMGSQGMPAGHHMSGPLAEAAAASPWGADVAMMLAHVGAALASAVVVRWGELLLASLCGRLRLAASAVASTTAVAARRIGLILGSSAPRPASLWRATGVDPEPHRPDSLRLVGTLRFRGPPRPA